MNGPLDPYRSTKYSQHGEDGILAFLCGRLGIEQGWCCEFGAGDGTDCSNTLALIEQGWHGLLIEPDMGFRDPLFALADRFPTLAILMAYIDDGTVTSRYGELVSREGVRIALLDTLLQEAGFPAHFDVLSIDTEGNHAAIWATLQTFRPRIVVIEIDSGYVGNLMRMGATGRTMGYTCLGHCGNLIFVRDEDVEAVGVEVLAPEALYTPLEPEW